MQTTIATILDTRRAKLDKTYPVKLRVTFILITAAGKRYIQKYFPTPYSLTAADFKKVMGSPKSDQHREIRRELNKLQYRAEEIVNSYEVITPEVFETQFTNKGLYRTVNDIFRLIIEKLEKEGRVSTVDTYKNALSSLKEFARKDEILFGEIGVDWLEEYEAWMVNEKGKSISTVGIYLRNLRRVYNVAIKRTLIKHDLYPFGKNGYVIPTSESFKRALTEEQKDALLAYECQDDAEQFALDIWKFSYFCWGMNFKDICHLRYKQITDTAIISVREKTKNTKKAEEPLVIPITEQARAVIRRWGRKSLNPDEYVFPILTYGGKPRTHQNQKKRVLQDVNNALSNIGDRLGWKFRLTTYSARHTFATILKNKGVNQRTIQEMLDHQSLLTTERYFKRTVTDEKLKVANLL